MKTKFFDDEIIFLKKYKFYESKILTIEDYQKINKSFSEEYILNNNRYLIRNNTIKHFYIKEENNKYDYDDDNINKIATIFRMVNQDASRAYNKRKIRNIELKNYHYSFFNVKNISKNKKNKVIGIDINYCYWNTAYNLGIITEHTYKYGLENVSKNIRNATIGSFASNIIFNKYDYDKIIERKIYKRKLYLLRNEIIYYVYKIAYNVQRLLKDDFLFFYVDCFYINNNQEAIDKVCNYLVKNKYQYKFKNVEILDLIQKDNTYSMNWINSEGKDVTNYINNSQVIQNF